MNFFVASLQRLSPLLLVIIAAISVVIGDLFAKYWSINKKDTFYFIAIIFYIGSAVFYIPSLLSKGLVITSVLWTLIATLGLLLVGLVIFKETLSSLQAIGLLFGIISLLILSFSFNQ